MPTFSKYESYQDSGVEWLGQIPKSWNQLNIRAVTDLKSERNRPDLPVLSVYREYGVLLKDSRDDNHNATSLDISNYKVVEVGDLVVNKMKAWQGSMGVSEHEGIVSPAYITCRVDAEKIEPKFLHYLLRSKIYISIYNALSYGVRIGQWDMHYEDFKKIPLPIPSIEEQKRIVEFLDRTTTEIDHAISQKQRLIELLQEQKTILINQAVTKGLNPNVPMRDSGIEWIGQIPKHWEIIRSRYLFREQNERSQDGSETHLSMSQKLGLVPSDELSEKTLQSDSYEGAKLCGKGDLVLNRLKAHLGVFSVSPCEGLVSPDYSVFRLIDSNMAPEYFESLFRTSLYISEFNKRVKGIVVGFYRLYTDAFYDIPCICPSEDEQKDIRNHILKINDEFKSAKNFINSEINKLIELKQIFIATSVTGKIKV